MSIDYNKRPSKQPASEPASLVKKSPVSLTKRGETVSLTKGGAGGAPLRINLNWDQKPAGATGGGFLKRLAGGTGAIDLDLGCLFELADGRKGAVQALGGNFGALDEAPFVKLDKDDRSGTATDGENLFVSGAHAHEIKRLAIFAFIYEGAKNWSQAGGVVTIHPAEGAPVTIALDETKDGVGMCAICIVQGGRDSFSIERQVQYIGGHKELDELFGFGLNWRAGRK